MCNGAYRWEKERKVALSTDFSIQTPCEACTQKVQAAVESVYDYGDAVGKTLVGNNEGGNVTMVGNQSFYIDAQGEVRKFSSAN